MSYPPRTTLPPELDPRGPRRGGARPGPTPRRRRLVRSLSWAAVILSAMTLLASVAGYAAFTYYNGKIGRITIGALGKGSGGKAQNFLIVGSDTRDFAGGKAFQADPGSADYVTGQRSDTVILAHVPGDGAKATIVSFPRDSWVEVPAYTDKSGQHHDAHEGKLNSAFAVGGPALLVRMIENLTGMPIDHYVQVDFDGFQRMVNALGGVTICVRTTRQDKDSGDYLTAGTHKVNGATALAFVRDRKGLPNGDVDRIKDQQHFIGQVVKKVTSAGTLANPFKLNAFLQAVTKAVTVDQGFGFNQMRTLALRFRHLDPAHVTFQTIPILTDSGWRNGQSVVLIDQNKADALFASLRGDATKKPAGPAYKVTVPPSQVSVEVQNGSGRSGLARQTGDQLAAQGFTVTGIGNGQSADTSVVRYPSDKADSARTVAAAIPGSRLQEDSSASGIVLVLGSNFSSVARVHVGGASSSPGKAPTPATPPEQTAASTDCAP